MRVKDFLNNNFTSVENKNVVFKSTAEMVEMLKKNKPLKPINKKEVCKILTNLGFKHYLHIEYKTEPASGKATNEIDYKVCVWVLYKKK